MKKRIVATMIAMVAAISLMGCGITTTSTYTETTTDADGNTVTTTTTTTNGETTTETTESAAPAEEEEIVTTVATVAFENQTDFEFAEMYFASGAADNWGENILGDTPLAIGSVVTYTDALTYSSDNTVWDMKVVDAEGNNVEFNGADMTVAADPENIYITFIFDEEAQSYTAEIQ